MQGLSRQPCAFTQPKRGDVLGVVPCAPVEGKASSLRLVEGRVVGPALKLQVEGQLPHVCADGGAAGTGPHWNLLRLLSAVLGVARGSRLWAEVPRVTAGLN